MIVKKKDFLDRKSGGATCLLVAALEADGSECVAGALLAGVGVLGREVPVAWQQHIRYKNNRNFNKQFRKGGYGTTVIRNREIGNRLVGWGPLNLLMKDHQPTSDLFRFRTFASFFSKHKFINIYIYYFVYINSDFIHNELTFYASITAGPIGVGLAVAAARHLALHGIRLPVTDTPVNRA